MGFSDPLSPSDDLAIEELFTAVADSAPNELEVTAIPGGFEVTYREELPTRGVYRRIDSSYLLRVTCDPTERTFTMEDHESVQFSDRRGPNWGKSGTRGRMYSVQTVKILERDESGNFVETDSITQRTRDMHKAVREPATQLGWSEKRPTSAIVGKIVAGIAGVGLIIGAAVVAVLFFTGNLT